MLHMEFSWKQWWTILVMMSVSAYPRQPSNIVFIMVDDMGWNDVSFHGSDQIMTPNIDALAYKGIILQQFYSEAICTPARSALLTGKYPMRLGMQGMPLYNSEDRGIPVTERLLPSYLKDLGYATHLVGKWHVGMSRREFLPTVRGYDTHYGMRGGFIDYYTYNKVETWPNGRMMFGLDLFDNDIPQIDESRYIVDVLTDRCVRIIEQHNASQPLFLHLTHNAPHAGNEGALLQPPLYRNVKHDYIAHSDRRLYAGVMTELDRSVGRVVQALADKNILDDTLIIFMSDNGAPTVGSLRNWGVNLPLRGRKYTPWEGAVRVPAFIWHSSFRPNVWNGLMHVTDWLPTLVAAANGRVNNAIDGINQWDPIVHGGESRRKEVFLTTDDNVNNVYASYRAGDFKVIVGNVTGLNNGYYGSAFMLTKGPLPEYYPTLQGSAVAKIFEERGVYLEVEDVEAMRTAATIKQEDPDRDATPCIPTLARGCLYNVRRDPSESHDLWNRAPKIATLLTSRMRALWSSQLRRGPPNLRLDAEPAKNDYVWETFVPDDRIYEIDGLNFLNFSLSHSVNKTSNKASTPAVAINCNGTTGIRNFLCILKSVYF